MHWKRTPKADLITALRLVDGAWEPCLYEQLRSGDIFRAVDPAGQQINPLTFDPDASIVSIVESSPVKAYAQDGLQGHGFAIEITTYESLVDLRRMRAN